MSITEREIARAIKRVKEAGIPLIEQKHSDYIVVLAFMAGVAEVAQAIADELQYEPGFDRAYFLARAGVGA